MTRCLVERVVLNALGIHDHSSEPPDETYQGVSEETLDVTHAQRYDCATCERCEQEEVSDGEQSVGRGYGKRHV
jgi:hypothetical protein